MNHQHLVPIHTFATMCRTTPRTIRFWESQGLLKPDYVDPYNKYRYYEPTHAIEFFKMKLLQNFHIPLNQIAQNLQDTSKKDVLNDRISHLQQQIDELEKEHTFLRTIKQFIFEEKQPQKHFKEETIAGGIFLCKQFPDGRYDRINADIMHLYEIAKQHNIPTLFRQMTFYLEMSKYKPKDTSLEICIEGKFDKIPKDIQLPEGYYFKKVKQMKMRVFTYKGPFDYIALIYQKIHHKYKNGQTLPKNALGFDIHLAGPWNKKSPYDHLTKLCFPVSKEKV